MVEFLIGEPSTGHAQPGEGDSGMQLRPREVPGDPSWTTANPGQVRTGDAYTPMQEQTNDDGRDDHGRVGSLVIHSYLGHQLSGEIGRKRGLPSLACLQNSQIGLCNIE